jgi:chaperonin cofactor prefoldin
MDQSTVTQLWMDLATNAPFVGFLLYQYWDQRKTNKEQRDEMREIRIEAKVNEDAVRQRFEKVITELNKDRDQLVDGFSTRIDSLERGQRKLFAILEPLKEQIHDIIRPSRCERVVMIQYWQRGFIKPLSFIFEKRLKNPCALLII